MVWRDGRLEQGGRDELAVGETEGAAGMTDLQEEGGRRFVSGGMKERRRRKTTDNKVHIRRERPTSLHSFISIFPSSTIQVQRTIRRNIHTQSRESLQHVRWRKMMENKAVEVKESHTMSQTCVYIREVYKLQRSESEV